MTFTDKYMDLGSTVYYYDDVDKLPHEKENAVLLYLSMICRSWTFDRMTQKEQESCVNAYLEALDYGRIKGSFSARWEVMQLMYSSFLAALGYGDDPGDWRRDYSETPRVIVEVNGGLVSAVYADRPVSVDVLDYDNYYAAEEGSEEEEHYSDLMCECGLLEKVW